MVYGDTLKTKGSCHFQCVTIDHNDKEMDLVWNFTWFDIHQLRHSFHSSVEVFISSSVEELVKESVHESVDEASVEGSVHESSIETSHDTRRSSSISSSVSSFMHFKHKDEGRTKCFAQHSCTLWPQVKTTFFALVE
ncbi:hypothetical protein AVEN_90867-1 [Araneus ventricosus]|uniref:Uncharacterized protein n=1 Tax=Araneus ventricosus TaxID=182803 RepID=A0A4Y2J8S7_ARAVE|nr:hypothetical protein AVEN_90867-1 [Araneus ventricosus]